LRPPCSSCVCGRRRAGFSVRRRTSVREADAPLPANAAARAAAGLHR
jgi:hypothetical protein